MPRIARNPRPPDGVDDDWSPGLAVFCGAVGFLLVLALLYGALWLCAQVAA